MDVRFTTQSATAIDADLLVVAVAGDLAPALTAVLGDGAADLAAYLERQGMTSKAGTSHTLPGLGHAKAHQLAIVGLGDDTAADRAKAYGKVGQLARAAKATSAALAGATLDAAALQDALEYVAVGNYFFEDYLPEKQKKPQLGSLAIVGHAPDGADDAIAAAAIRARHQRWCRDLVNLPAGDLYPETLAAQATETLGAIDGVTVEVWDLAKCIDEGLVGIEAVGRGSTKPGVLIKATYAPAGAKDHVALVGKGVTFDAGGLSLKPSNAMQTMRCDMGGAATTLATFAAVAELGLDVAVTAFVPSVENMVAGDSFKLGDILTYRNGVSVEIHNTDAEGRLILADALCLASEEDSVSTIVDMATLTGAIIVSLGPDYTGLFTKDDALAGALLDATAVTGEKMWRMPLDDAYNRMLKGTWGQIKNVGGREGGSITAALYLQHFVGEGKRWAHLDIAGTAFADAALDPYVTGGTGQVVRALTTWLAGIAEG